MFENFSMVSNGWLSIILMTYCATVSYECLRLTQIKVYRLYAPPVLFSPFAAIFFLAATPCTIFPAILIGMYDGLTSGFIAWIGMQVVSAIMTFALAIRSQIIALHYLIAFITLPIAYYLEIKMMISV